MLIVLSTVIGYLVGSIPFGVLLCRYVLGIDIIQRGSGNIGATNVQRNTNTIYGLIVLTFDLLKGFVSAWIGFSLAGEYGAILSGIASVAGHNWSLYLNFGGGKGVATTAGIALFLFPKSVLVLLPLWVGVVALTRYVSLASVIAAAAMPFAVYFLGYPPSFVVTSILTAIFAIYRHKSNIERLRTKTETKFSLKKKK
jgi:glycerol-3-phosphate acyltransferase PlsY